MLNKSKYSITENPMFQGELPDALIHAITAYQHFFATTSALAVAIFGISIFVILRAIGLIHDQAYRGSNNVVLLLIGGISALITVVLGFIADNTVLAYYVELLRDSAFDGCKFPKDRKPTTFFLECHRKLLVWLVWMDIFTSLTSLSCVGYWFYSQTRRLRNEERCNHNGNIDSESDNGIGPRK